MPLFPTEKTGYLTDKLLIATHSINDGCFNKTVIYLCAHSDDGALGIIINMPLSGLSITSLMDELEIQHIDDIPDRPIYFGGPVETNQGFILHTDDRLYKGSIRFDSGICFSAGISFLEDLAKGSGPEKFTLALGSAGWSAGQLESELESGSWIIAPATPALLFDIPPNNQWEAAAGSLGVDLDRLDAHVGHA